MTATEDLADDIAAVHKAADDLLDTLHYLRRQHYPYPTTPAVVTEAIDHAHQVWMRARLDFPKLVQQ